MNAKMKALLDEMRTKQAQARAAVDVGDQEKAAVCLAEFGELEKNYKLEEQIFKAEQSLVPDYNELEAKAKAGFEGATENGFTIIGKVLKGKALSDKEHDILRGVGTDMEKAMITGGTGSEDLLVPQDVRVAINELRTSYKSAKDLVTVIPTTTMAGSFNFEKGEPTGLVNFADGAVIDSSKQPEFEVSKYEIKLMGRIIPVSNILAQVEQAGLLAYINQWFVKNAIVSENKDIFNMLQTGAITAIKGLEQLKKSMNRDLNPGYLIGAKIVTNQTGFDLMDSETDGNGRPMLQPSPTDPTKMLFKGYPIEVFSNTILPDISANKAPLFFGALDAAQYFIDLMGYQFASSEHFYFGQHQNALRIIEGYNTMLADKKSYVYATFEAKAKSAG